MGDNRPPAALACLLLAAACGGCCARDCVDLAENFEMEYAVYDSRSENLFFVGRCVYSGCLASGEELPITATGLTVDAAAGTYESTQETPDWELEDFSETMDHYGLDRRRVESLASMPISEHSCRDCLLEVPAPGDILLRFFTGKNAQGKPLRLQVLSGDEIRIDLLLGYDVTKAT